MMTGAFAYGVYAIPRSSKDVDVVLSVAEPKIINRVIEQMSGEVEFGEQVQFDTLTWGKRHVGRVREMPQLQVERFELFDDAFVLRQFERRACVRSSALGKGMWIPTAEDVLVQKLRWARAKDLDDARDVLLVQGSDSLDMGYVRRWCREHGSEERLDEILAKLPDI
jgi:hypothetical protein